MRLNPPLAVSGLIALALARLALTWRSEECYFAPDGQRRFSNLLQAAAARVEAGPNCDVWSGITPKKSVETIELSQRTSGGARLVARVEPSGGGFVAVVPPYANLDHPTWKQDNPTLNDFQEYSKVFQFSDPDGHVYRRVYNLISPLRDFQGGWALDPDMKSLQEIFETRDLRTRKIVCRRELGVMPARHGPVITFRFSNREQPAVVMTGVNCDDVAQRNANLRNQKAIQEIVQATNQTVAIRDASEVEWPYCGEIEPSPEIACLMPIL